MKLIETDIKSPIVIYKGKIRSMTQNSLLLQPKPYFLQEGKNGYGVHISTCTCMHMCV